MEDRYRQHISQLNPRNHKTNWIRRLLSLGKKPLMIELETVQPGGDWEERERYWISYYRELGFSLTNATDGGEGISGYVHSDETRARMSETQMGNTKNLGKKRSDETRRKQSASLKGRKPSEAALTASLAPDVVARRAASNTGKKRSAEACARISAGSKGNKNRLGTHQSPETREKLRLLNTGKCHSDETRAKMSATRKGRKPSENNRKALCSPETNAKRTESIRRKAELKRLAILIALLASSKEVA